MSELRILGASDAAVALLIDAWAAAPGRTALERVVVVQNVPVEPRLPCALEPVEVVRVLHCETGAWLDSRAPTVLGAYRPAVKAAVLGFFAARYGIAAEHYARTASRSANVSPSVRQGPGTWIGPGAVIGPFTTLGSLVTVNRGALVGHHVQVDALATLGPGCIIGGGARIGARASIAMGAKVLDGIEIGADATVGAGAVVTRPVPPRTVVYGVPARPVRPAAAPGSP